LRLNQLVSVELSVPQQVHINKIDVEGDIGPARC